MLMLKGVFKVETGDMCHFLPIVDVKREKIPYDLSFLGDLIGL